jgi:diguanylate cyclase (GGDEF)-like protein/PAS domain S-box-containing protein
MVCSSLVWFAPARIGVFAVLLICLIFLIYYVLTSKKLEEWMFGREISELIIEKNPCMIYLKDWDGTYSLANKAFAEMFGTTPERIVGRTELDFNPSATDIEERLEEDRQLMNGSVPKVVFECPFENYKRETRWVQVIKIPIDHMGEKQILCVATDITDRKQYEELIHHQATHDTLTRLPNRHKFYEDLAKLTQTDHDGSRQFALLFLDLDRFKLINDTFGHSTGDLILTTISDQLQSTVSARAGTLYRLAGDEFVVLVPEAGYEAAGELAKLLLETFTQAISIADNEFIVTPSIGISLYPEHGVDGDTLLKNADTAMYRAKEQGKNTYHYYTFDPVVSGKSRLALEYHLRQALPRDELRLVYQPKMNLTTHEVIGVEALLRWHHPSFGIVSPAEFVPLAEETGLIIPISEWVLREACQQAKRWQEQGLAPFVVSVNLSTLQFQRDVVSLVDQVLQETQLEGKWLELEITESILMRNEEYIISVLNELRSRGIQISIDDFGTGYSSLSYLQSFPLDTLKIAQPFVRDLEGVSSNATIASTIITLGHSLNLKVIAEGVETPYQMQFLQENGCDEMQGFLLSKPLAAAEFDVWMQSPEKKLQDA